MAEDGGPSGGASDDPAPGMDEPGQRSDDPRVPGGGSGQERDPRAALDDLRREIQALDASLIRLIGQRRDLVLRIGRAKEELGLPVLDPAREAKVARRVAELSRQLGVDEELARDVIWRIMASARDAQRS